MLIQLSSIQVPSFWEVIKFGALESDEVKKEYQGVYCLTLLQDLLSGKKLCFIGKKDNNIVIIFIISFHIDSMTGVRHLYVHNIYSFNHQSKEVWLETFKDMIEVATKAQCKVMTAESKNPRMAEIADYTGVGSTIRKYSFNL